MIQIRFWGTRGSLPVATAGGIIREKVKRALLEADGRRFEDAEALERFMDESLDFSTRHGYGGDTSCVELIDGEETILCDMGTGLRRFGQQAPSRFGTTPKEYHIFLSHLHWDHIMGLPFFPPAYIPGNRIHLYGGHSIANMEKAFLKQQSPPSFPVHWNDMDADIDFTHLDVDTWHDIAGYQVLLHRQTHHGGSFGYRFEKNGKAIVYATDAEHKQDDESVTQGVIDFLDQADIVIFDAMYSMADMITIKEDWGHSSNIVGVDLCLRAGVRHFCMFHHEPAYSDDMIHQVLMETRRYAELIGEGRPMEITSAYDDMVITV